MVRTSAKQKLLRDVGQALLKSVQAAAARARRDQDDDFDSDNASTSTLFVDSDDEMDLDSLDDSSSDSLFGMDLSEASCLSELSDIDSSDDDLSRHTCLAAQFYRDMHKPRVINPKREKRQTVKIHLQMQRLRDSGLPTDMRTFRRLVRVLPTAFDNLEQILSPHPVFATKDPRRPQAPVAEQLAVTLYWLGRSENGAGAEDVALACGCAEGSVIAYVDRVVETLYDARAVTLCWASEDEKASARDWVEQRSGCSYLTRGWCMADGSQIPLAFKPSKGAHSKEYFDRKMQYALNLQLTLNNRRIDNAKELREDLHCALFEARGREFEHTTRESRLQSLTLAELLAKQEKALRRAAARRAQTEARREQRIAARGGYSQRGRGRGRGRGRRVVSSSNDQT
ncbi:hypothetical protein V8E36_008232 [Tilletia maclaganii]